VGVAFKNGVPESLNHGDPTVLPAPLQAGGMTWGWLFGYKFFTVQLAATASPTGDAAPGLGLLHLGSVQCDNTPADGGAEAGPNYGAPPTMSCAQSNRPEIRLMGYTLGTSVIVADAGAVFESTDLTQDQQCHSAGPACPSMFASLGLDFNDGSQLATQAVYRVE
jgi:uncharacterized repeat protein (TIGR04052 family)